MNCTGEISRGSQTKGEGSAELLAGNGVSLLGRLGQPNKSLLVVRFVSE
jgi:hypothetical protein